MGCEGWAQKEAAVSTRKADGAPAPGAAEPEIPLELSLPGPSFTSEAEFAREREAILFADWFCVGREESLAGPGDYLTADVAGESILIVRGADRPGSQGGQRGPGGTGGRRAGQFPGRLTTCAGTAAPGSSRWPVPSRAATGRAAAARAPRSAAPTTPGPTASTGRCAPRRSCPSCAATATGWRCTRSPSPPGAGSSSPGSTPAAAARARWPAS